MISLFKHSISFILLAVFAGCAGPEDGRQRGGGHGGDGGNFSAPIHVPSKLDGTKSLPPNPT